MSLNWNLVWAVVWRHLYNFRHSLDRIVDAFYWPALDILLWGFASVFITQRSGAIPGLITALLSGVILWIAIWRGQYEITVNLLEEMWARNLVNLFATPLRVREWIVAVFILGLVKLIPALVFASLLAYLVYQTNVLTLGFFLIPFMASLMISGWAFGLIVASLIVNWGMRIQTIAWSGIFLLGPISGVFYPISTLPSWAQKIASVLPTTYVFEGMRAIVFYNQVPWDMFVKSLALNGVFLLLGVFLFNFMFEKSKIKGLARLE